MAELLLVRYGEMALKSPPVRREFERQLRRNILDQLLASGLVGRLRSDHGHLYAEVEEATAGVRALCRVFGVTSVSHVHEVPTERGAIRASLLALADPILIPGSGFAIRARRTGSHPFTSQELGRDLGSDVLERFADRNLHVDLTHPGVELFVEVRGPRTYLYLGREAGPGGLPLGVAGRVVALVDGPRGALGAYLMMKRGCHCALVSLPEGSALVEQVLRRFDPAARTKAVTLSSGEWESELARIADDTHADGVVLPIAVDGYAHARERWGDRVLFSPTVGLSEEEVDQRWRRVVSLAA